ncbi:PAS domain S-box-containing protein [Breoghania corrubedonensis]|uniref:histidine kinase n=1 Tax=Breoghania corrubedonensis TaxID=665038 RepID=A0A2T5V8P3_9HYPH|nr:hybrid sensor histidine kinase/response regulator [Breoghania corrubedonensis]PTW60104.1 PAS domain S-box-containing protein [Breoghania corrubedonensis]
MRRLLGYRFGSLTYRIMFLVCFSVVASTATLGLLVYSEIRQITRDQAVDSIASETRLMTQRFELIYSAMARNLRTLAGVPAVDGIIRSLQSAGPDPSDGSTTNRLRARLESTFRAVLQSNPEYFKIRFVGYPDQGQELVRVERIGRGTIVRPNTALTQVAAEPYFKFGIAQPSNQVSFSDVSYEYEDNDSRLRKRLVVRGMIPVDDAGGRRFGLIVITADYEAMLRWAMGGTVDHSFMIAVNGGEEDYIQRAPGEPAGHVTLQLRSDPSHRPTPLISAVLSSQEREGLIQFGDMIAYFVRDSGKYSQYSAQIGFATQMPAEALLGYANVVRDRMITICVIAAFLFGVIAVLVTRRLINPLGSLTRMILESSDEELIAELPTARYDEIGDLARSFQQRTQALIDSEARAKVIVNNAPDGLILINEDGIIEGFNPSCERLFGYEAQDVIGQHVEILLPEHMSQYTQIFGDISEILRDPAHPGTMRELEVKTSRGGRVPVEISVSALTLEGKPKLSGAIRDISERREIERVRTEFVATVSHELRTPLTSIRGALVLMDQIMAKPRPEKIERMLSMAQKNTSRLILLVNDILDFEKLQAEKVNFQLSRCDLNDEIGKSVDMNMTFAQERKVTLKAVMASEPLVCPVDQDRLQQVLANLISNAAKFSRENGRVEVGVERVGMDARLFVTDHGAGIPRDFHDKIFTPFSQANTGSSAKRAGTGLGLIITKRLVEGMGGTIGFHSTMGEGTTFWVTFPLIEWRERNTRGAPPRHIGLHLEDDADFAEVLRTAVEDDIELVNVATLEEARRQLRERSFDLVIIDIALHKGDGLALIKSIPAPDRTAIVVLTALDETVDNPEVDLTMVKSKHQIGDVTARIMRLLEKKAALKEATS